MDGYHSRSKRGTTINVGKHRITINEKVNKRISLQKCGKNRYKEVRVVNGRNAPQGKYPWMVAVLKYGTMWCGGSIISDTWVISAAHCFFE